MTTDEPMLDAPRVAGSADSTRASAGGLRTRHTTSIAELLDLRDQWQDLGRSASDPNPFYEPWYFLPAVTRFGGRDRWRFVIVERDLPQAPRPQLCGFFPFALRTGRGGLKHWSLWRHPLIFLTSPLVRRGCETAVWNELWASLAGNESRSWSVDFPMMGETGELQTGFVESVRDNLRSTYLHDRWPRAILNYPTDPQHYLKNVLDGHHLREIKRLRRKLEQSGQLQYRSLTDPDYANVWSEWFLDLEANGWKASQGTALKQNEATAGFFREIVREGCRTGDLTLQGLFLDGEPAALKCNLHRRPATFAFKIAYNEALKKYSPGVQLELESLERYSRDPEIAWGDSCAIPRHSMIERLWSGRRIIQHVQVSTGTCSSDLFVSTLPLARAAKRVGRRMWNHLKSKFPARSQNGR